MLNLDREFARLNDEQKAAVLNDGNTAVIAGPGSGKTATLVIKIAQLLSGQIKGPRSVACITYNNDAVAEFRSRLAEHGIHAGRALFLGTVHSFCLNAVLRPFAPLAAGRFREGVEPARPSLADDWLEAAIREHMPGEKPSWQVPTITRYRRALACGEDVTNFDDRIPSVVEKYQASLAEAAVVDFEEMVLAALELLRNEAWAIDLLVARYPWLIVDEYQDLGGPLHQLVTLLADAGIGVFAVGDPDQTIYDFTGADPAYLTAFAGRPDVKSIRLRFNYRSGQTLINAGEAGLGQERGYKADPNRAVEGRIEFETASSAMDDHAAKAATAAAREIAKGTPPHEIAVFYQRKTLLLNELETALARANVPFRAERNSSYPVSPLTRWLQAAARWTLEDDQPFEDIFRYYRSLLESSGRIEGGDSDLRSRRKLSEVLGNTRAGTLAEWFVRLNEALALRSLLVDAGDRSDDLDAFDAISKLPKETELSDFSNDGIVEGKVALTTFHSSKGRQFDAVIIPGLTEGILPTWTFNRRTKKYESPSAKRLQEERRLFYVGFTRARHVVYLVSSRAFSNNWYTNDLGVSRFVTEIQRRLADE